jgi:hypothetical protein
MHSKLLGQKTKTQNNYDGINKTLNIERIDNIIFVTSIQES